MKSAISWFEIPATNLDRASEFYETIFGISLIPMDLPDIKMRMFPVHKPSATDGPLIYLNGNPDVQKVLDTPKETG